MWTSTAIRRGAVCFVVLILTLGWVPLTQAQTTWYVDDDNCPGPGSGTPEDPFCRIQLGISSASDGDAVQVMPGTYAERINYLGTAVRVYSFSGDPEDTIIDGGGAGTVVTMDSFEESDSVLEGLTITGGLSVYGGGMYLYWSNPTINDCVFVGNVAEDDAPAGMGGAMFTLSSHPTVTDCKFIDNEAGWGGAVFSDFNNGLFSRCEFTGNRAFSLHAGGAGGAIYTQIDAALRVSECTFSDNTARDYGGAIYGMDSGARVSDCEFTGNSAMFGGALYNLYGAVTLTRCTITGGTADSGAGMLNQECEATVTDCVFRDNIAELEAGGIFNMRNAATVSGCRFEGNDGGNKGGGISNWISSPTVTDCAFVNNTAAAGAGVYGYRDGSAFTNCAFTGNTADTTGGAVSIFSRTAPSDSTFANCSFLNNAAGNGRSLACDSDNQQVPSDVHMTNCVLWNGGDEIWNNDASTITITYSDVTGGYEGTGNINADPQCDSEGRHQAGSPCIDAGDNWAVPVGVTEDLDGNPRFVDDPATDDTGRGTPPIVDMGAYEYQAPECPYDLDGSGAVDFADILAVLTAWGDADAPEDLDGSGTVDFADLLLVLANWGPC